MINSQVWWHTETVRLTFKVKDNCNVKLITQFPLNKLTSTEHGFHDSWSCKRTLRNDLPIPLKQALPYLWHVLNKFQMAWCEIWNPTSRGLCEWPGLPGDHKAWNILNWNPKPSETFHILQTSHRLMKQASASPPSSLELQAEIFCVTSSEPCFLFCLYFLFPPKWSASKILKLFT